MLGLFVFQEMAESSRKRSRNEMAKVLKEKFKKRMLVVEWGVKVAVLKDLLFLILFEIGVGCPCFNQSMPILNLFVSFTQTLIR